MKIDCVWGDLRTVAVARYQGKEDMDEVGRICVQIGVNIFPSLFDKCVKFNKIVNFIKIYIYTFLQRNSQSVV